MSEHPDPQQNDVNRSGGIDISGGKTRAGRDIAGRDIVTGFSADAVQKLLLTVGGLIGTLVICTALCFLVSGLLVGAAFAELSRGVPVSGAAADSASNKFSLINQLRPGQRANFTLTESELSSYINQLAGPQFGLTNGEVRFPKNPTRPGEFVIAGNYRDLGNAYVAAMMRLIPNASTPLQIESAGVRVVNTNSPVGWVPVPTSVGQPLVDQLNTTMFKRVTINDVKQQEVSGQRIWTLTATGK